MTHVMRVMGLEGDVKLIWDTDKKVEVDAARGSSLEGNAILTNRPA